MTAEYRTIAGYSYPTLYTYDAPGRLIEIVYPSGRKVVYAYDAQGRITYVGLKRSATAAEEAVVPWVAYDPFGGVRGVDSANGLALWNNADLEYRPAALYLSPSSGGAPVIERN